MRRVIFNLVAAFSLLLALTSAALWVRSHFVRDIYTYAKAGGDSYVAQSLLGRFHLVINFAHPVALTTSGSSYQSDRLSPNAIWTGGMSGYPVTPQWLPGGFIYQQYSRGHLRPSPQPSPGAVGVMGFTTGHRLIVVPYWAPTALLALVPAVWLYRRLGPPSGRPGFCVECDYDMRATPERCPECGTPAAVGER